MAGGDYEVIVVLNGPKKYYEYSICKYIHENPQLCIRYFYSETPGVSNARNLGLDQAEGEFIAFIDDDDYVSKSYLRELYEKSSPDTIGLVYPYAFNDGSPEVQLDYSISDEYERCAAKGRQSYLRPKKFFSGPCMKLIHRDVIGNRRFDARFKNGEDSLFMFLISDSMKYVDFTSKDAVYYRRFRENSATTSQKSVKEMFDNCWQRFKANSKVYFSDVRHYSLQRYCMSILGLFHIVLSEIIVARLFK
jgi:glycosyltransferase involved in cell wall biosynthesis